MEVIRLSEMRVNLYRTQRHYNPEYCSLHGRRCGNLKYKTVIETLE
jgi:hypothetical protein